MDMYISPIVVREHHASVYSHILREASGIAHSTETTRIKLLQGNGPEYGSHATITNNHFPFLRAERHISLMYRADKGLYDNI